MVKKNNEAIVKISISNAFDKLFLNNFISVVYYDNQVERELFRILHLNKCEIIQNP